MSIVYIAKGTCHLGRTQTDKDGNILSSTPAHFEINNAGGSVVVGLLDQESMQPDGPASGIFGDYDAAGYLSEALKLLQPNRKVNVPDIERIVKKAYTEDGNDLLCDYCESLNCRNCIIKEWKDEAEDGQM